VEFEIHPRPLITISDQSQVGGQIPSDVAKPRPPSKYHICVILYVSSLHAIFPKSPKIIAGLSAMSTLFLQILEFYIA
jgi:hypothetical protein